MQVLRGNIDSDSFFHSLTQAGRGALLLDYDGTLAPFVTDRQHAVPYPGVRELLRLIMQSKHTNLAIISGRTIKDLSRLLDLEPLPELWGSHGFEHRDSSGCLQLGDIVPEATVFLEEVRRWAVAEGLHGQMEEKPAGLAFHWRGLPATEAERLRESIQTYCSEQVGLVGLKLHEFDGGLELRPEVFTKANAVDRFLARFHSPLPAAYLGDDLTDEDAFVAIRGQGLAVLVRRELRETQAHWWLRPPDELIAFLQRWHECLVSRTA